MIEGGIRTKDSKKIFDENLPVLTIITVVRNCEQLIENTIQNILNQNYSNLEYIIIDGKSTDSTLEIIRKYDSYIDYWISEPDNGIYDAMNKGILLATGNWINFMNAGDFFYNNGTICLIIDKMKNDVFDVVYGDLIALDTLNLREISFKAKPIKKIWTGMIFSHQSVFIRTEILKKHLFNLKFKIVADYNQILTLYTSNYRFGYTGLTIAKISIDGISYSNINTIKENIEVVKMFKPKVVVWYLFLKIYIIILLKNVLGEKISKHVRKLKWSIKI